MSGIPPRDEWPSGDEIQRHPSRFLPTKEQIASLEPGDVVEGYIAATYFHFDRLRLDESDSSRQETERDLADRIFCAADDPFSIEYDKLEVEVLDLFDPHGDDLCAFFRVTM